MLQEINNQRLMFFFMTSNIHVLCLPASSNVVHNPFVSLISPGPDWSLNMAPSSEPDSVSKNVQSCFQLSESCAFHIIRLALMAVQPVWLGLQCWVVVLLILIHTHIWRLDRIANTQRAKTLAISLCAVVTHEYWALSFRVDICCWQKPLNCWQDWHFSHSWTPLFMYNFPLFLDSRQDLKDCLPSMPSTQTAFHELYSAGRASWH